MRTMSLPAFAALMTTVGMEMDHVNHRALDRAGRIVRDEARRVLGTYDYNWPSLAPSTLARKAADTPGIETREMHDSVQYRADHRTAEIGTDLEKAVWFELGTSRQPARSFLAAAAQHMEHEVVRTIGRQVVATLEGNVLGRSLLP